MKDNQIIGNGEWLDMSSNQPHVTVICPLCGTSFMKKVEFYKVLHTPCECKVMYVLTGYGSLVNVEMTLSKEQSEQYFKK